MHLIHSPWLRLAAIVAATSCSGADARAGEVIVLARWQNQKLQIIESSGLPVPLPHAGFYVEWVNEQEFTRRQHLKESTTYRVVGSVAGTEVSRFPEGWGARSNQPYSTYYVQAESATRVEDNDLSSKTWTGPLWFSLRVSFCCS